MTQSPFKFLDSYTKQDKDIFFGRESEVEELYTKIFQGKILLLYGASGTGKSSLISCGLANRFLDSDWLPINIRRGLNINDSFRQQLERCVLTPLSSKAQSSVPKVIKSIYLDHFKPIFIVFDQFEELFIFGDREEWEKFVTTIRELLDAELQVRFVFIIRGEYLEHLTDFEHVIPEIFGNRMRIEKMTRVNAMNCITGPCRSVGIEVEDHFSENLLNKLSPNKTEIELTYLQVFLDRIFKKAGDKRQNGKIVFSNVLLNELGNVGDVLSQFLDEQIALIPESEKALALLKAFVSTNATKKQISATQATDFVKTIGRPMDEKEVNMLIQELVSRRILKDKDEAGNYELRHDSIAAKIFEKITTYERDLIEVSEFITYAFGEHEKRDFLLNESDLAYIAAYETKLNLPDDVKAFIVRSKLIVRRKNRSRKQFYLVMGVISFLLVTSVAGLIYSQRQKFAADESAALALEQSNEATRQRLEAEKQKGLAEEKRLEADAQAKNARAQSEIALAQKQEADRQRMIANSLKQNAEQGQKDALEQKERAEAAKREAEQYAQLADKNLQLANEEKAKADRFRMLAIAQAMGAKAVQLQDTEQKLLVARQAFLFNAKYDGYAFQADIYNGVYSAYKAVKGDKFNAVQAHSGAVKGIARLSGNLLITVGSDGKINRVGHAGPATPIVTLIDSQPYVFHALALSPGKDRLAVGSEEGKLLIYDVSTMKKLNELDGHGGSLWATVFDGEGNLYTGGNDGKVLRWSKSSLEPMEIFSAGSAINALSLSAKTNALAVGMANGKVIILNPSAQRADAVNALNEGKSVTQVRFNALGTVLAVGKEDGSIVLRDVATSQVIESLSGHVGMVSDLQFNQDDTFLLSASYDGTAMLWNLKSLTQRQVVFADHGGWVLQAAFSSDGTKVWTGDALGALRHFPLAMDDYATGLCDNAKRNMTRKEWANFVGDDKDTPYEKTCLK